MGWNRSSLTTTTTATTEAWTIALSTGQEDDDLLDRGQGGVFTGGVGREQELGQKQVEVRQQRERDEGAPGGEGPAVRDSLEARGGRSGAPSQDVGAYQPGGNAEGDQR